MDKRLTEAVKVHQEGNIESAIKMYKQLLEADNYSEILFMNLGSALRKQGNLEEACGVLEQGLQLFPNEEGILNNYGNVLGEKGDHSLAASQFELLLKLKPSKPEYWKSFIRNLDLSGAWKRAYKECQNFLLNDEISEADDRVFNLMALDILSRNKVRIPI